MRPYNTSTKVMLSNGTWLLQLLLNPNEDVHTKHLYCQSHAQTDLMGSRLSQRTHLEIAPSALTQSPQEGCAVSTASEVTLPVLPNCTTPAGLDPVVLACDTLLVSASGTTAAAGVLVEALPPRRDFLLPQVLLRLGKGMAAYAALWMVVAAACEAM